MSLELAPLVNETACNASDNFICTVGPMSACVCVSACGTDTFPLTALLQSTYCSEAKFYCLGGVVHTM